MSLGVKWAVPVGTTALTAAIFLVDYFFPLGYAVWLTYLFPLWIAQYAPYARFPSVLAAACTSLIIADFVLSPAGADPKIVVFNRAIGIAVIWVMALLLERGVRAEGVRRRLFQELVRSQDRLRQLSHRLLQAQEIERRQVARDLHDEIGQALTALKLNLREMQGLHGPVQMQHMTVDSVQITDELLNRIRNMALDLRPSMLDELGLVPAIEWYLTRQAARAGWTVDFKVQDFERRLSSEVEITCFRVFQESLTNVLRHAKATHVSVTLSQNEGVAELRIQDNGEGFDIEEGRARARAGNSIGLLGMEERVHLSGGSIEIQSRPCHGTTVIVRCPTAPARADSQFPQQEAA